MLPEEEVSGIRNFKSPGGCSEYVIYCPSQLTSSSSASSTDMRLKKKVRVSAAALAVDGGSKPLKLEQEEEVTPKSEKNEEDDKSWKDDGDSSCGGEVFVCLKDWSRRKAELEESWWIWNQQVDLMDRFERIVAVAELAEDCLKTTTIRDLPETCPVSPGEVDSGDITFIKSPSEFYMVLKRMDYSLDNVEWTKFFPRFHSGLEARRGMYGLLTLFYKVAPIVGLELRQVQFKPEKDDLVSVKVIRHIQSNENLRNEYDSDDNIKFQIRRGLVRKVCEVSPNELEYTVYLLDYGFEIVVSGNFLYPLFKPFNCIAPLAVKCALHGISPVGEYWDKTSILYFSQIIEKHRKALFSVQFYSIVEPFSFLKLSSIVNLQAHAVHPKIGYLKLRINFSTDLIKGGFGIPWNLTPSRPKIMAGTEIPTTHNPPGYTSKNFRFTLTPRNAMLLTSFFPSVVYPMLPSVLKRELDRLFRLRGRELYDVRGMHNQLLLFLKDPGFHLQKPAVIASFPWENETDEEAEDNLSLTQLNYDSVVA